MPEQEPPGAHSTEQPQEELQSTSPLHEFLRQVTVQKPAPQVMSPRQELSSQVTVQVPVPQVRLPVQDAAGPQEIVTFVALEQSMAPRQPWLPQVIATSHPVGQTHPLLQAS